MLNRIPLRSRMLVVGLALLVIPLAIIVGVVFVSELRMREAARVEVATRQDHGSWLIEQRSRHVEVPVAAYWIVTSSRPECASCARAACV